MSTININGTRIYSALNVPTNCRSRNLPKLSDSKCCELTSLLSETQVVIIDEISVVSNIKTKYDKAFAGKTVLAVGDLLQLPPAESCSVSCSVFTPIISPIDWRYIQFVKALSNV